MVNFLYEICSFGDVGIKQNQEKIRKLLFLNSKNYNNAVIPTFIDKNDLIVVLPHSIGKGEENVNLNSCFRHGRITRNYAEIEYFTVFFQLFANMCKDRNFLCKLSIFKCFPTNFLIKNI